MLEPGDTILVIAPMEALLTLEAMNQPHEGAASPAARGQDRRRQLARPSRRRIATAPRPPVDSATAVRPALTDVQIESRAWRCPTFRSALYFPPAGIVSPSEPERKRWTARLTSARFNHFSIVIDADRAVAGLLVKDGG